MNRLFYNSFAKVRSIVAHGVVCMLLFAVTSCGNSQKSPENECVWKDEYKWVCVCEWGRQTITENTPFSWRNDVPALTINEKTLKIMPPLDMERLFCEDINSRLARFGYPHKVNYNLENSGEWIILPKGDRLWRLTISSPGALAFNILFDQFWMPNGAKFWAYDNDHRHSMDAMTSIFNDRQGSATGLIYGDHITLEYFLPNYASGNSFISIAYVVHGYRLIRRPGCICQFPRW